MADLINIFNFDLGYVRATLGVIHAWKSRELDPRDEAFKLIARHWMGDWGDLRAFENDLNDQAIAEGTYLRVISRYQIDVDLTVYITTEADRTATTIRLASEYP